MNNIEAYNLSELLNKDISEFIFIENEERILILNINGLLCFNFTFNSL